MSAAITLAADTELCHLPAALPLRRGGALHGAVLAFERQGPRHAPVVVVQGGISADRHVSAHAARPRRGWWEGFVGPGAPIDTARVQVLACDWLVPPSPAAGAAPLVDTADQADALAWLLDRLGIERLHAYVGASYGGMVGLQFAARHPARLRRLCALGAADRPRALAAGLRHVQRRIVAFGERHGDGAAALALARELALLTYRCPDGLQARFGDPVTVAPDGPRHPIADWLQARGAAYAAVHAPATFSALSASIDAHAVDPTAVAVPTWLVSFTGDQLVPPPQVAALARALPHCVRHATVPTAYGHDGFLREPTALAPLLAEVTA